MSDFDFIEAVKNMKTIAEICKELQIDYSNVTTNKASKENTKKVADRLKVEIFKLYAIASFYKSEEK